MTWRGRIGLVLLGASIPIVAGVAVALVKSAGSAARSGLSSSMSSARPWGAFDFEIDPASKPSGLEGSIAQSLRDEHSSHFDPDGDGVKNYDFLALSGGGSHGAFGAGVLCGWSERGDRPDFRIVTGISTGALQATSAFIGSDGDRLLEQAFTGISNEDVFVSRSPIDALFTDGAKDTTPLRRMLERMIDDSMLAAVAAKHRRGGRLFVGTTNIDGGTFVMWDLGAIAASGRPDARQRYIDVLMASSAVPALFPPVYFDVEIDGKVQRQMHVDGGAASQMFFRGLMLDLVDAIDAAGSERPRPHMRLFLLRNGRADGSARSGLVQPNTLDIASASIEQLFRLSTSSSLFRIYTLAKRYGIEFNMRSISGELTPTFSNADFNREGMSALFEAGRQLGRGSTPWSSLPPGIGPDELDPSDVHDAAER
ncbi:MAG: patatin-like phospholipase family protein [Phycisphaerales bacterium]